jgi:type IV pilus assembly protein PilX
MKLRAHGKTLGHKERGVVLFIALIVLVAMTMAGIAMIRSVDTALGIAGNMAFKQATVQASDTGIKAATDWLSAHSAGTTLQNTDGTSGYYSAATELPWFDINSWGGAVVLNGGQPDSAGNVVRYVIHRMCTQPDTAYNGPNNQCALYYSSGGSCPGCSMSVGASQFTGIPQLYYRITTRVDGPRNTVSIMQVNILIQV